MISCCRVGAQAGPPGRARLAGELREMDQDILKLTRSLAVSALESTLSELGMCLFKMFHA